jgi:hypothetical protein
MSGLGYIFADQAPYRWPLPDPVISSDPIALKTAPQNFSQDY